MSNKYFGPDVDEAIRKFQQEENEKIKQQLVKDKIWPAFEKLASYHYHNLPVRKNEESIYDCVVYLYEKIPMYDYEKKSQAFSYFNMIAKHFFYQKLKMEKREVTNNEENVVNINDSSIAENDSLISENFELDIQKKEFVDLFKQQLQKWAQKATKANEKSVIEALIVIFDNIDNIDIYKKKAIFFYIKEITNLNSKQIASTLAKLNKKFKKFKQKYSKGDI